MPLTLKLVKALLYAYTLGSAVQLLQYNVFKALLSVTVRVVRFGQELHNTVPSLVLLVKVIEVKLVLGHCSLTRSLKLLNPVRPESFEHESK